MRISSLLFAAVLTTACMPSVHLQVLEPADIFVPIHIERIAVVDRSAPPQGGGGQLLAAAEGLLTGENILEDRHGSARAVTAVTEGLAASPRFDVVRPPVELRGAIGGAMPDPLRWRRVIKICEQNDADALLTLAAFDSDSWVTVEPFQKTLTTEAGKEVEVTRFAAERETTVRVGWRLYDPEQKVIIDQLTSNESRDTWSHEGIDEQDARDALPAQGDTVADVGEEAGRAYARRIAPGWTTVTRRYYASGHPVLKETKSLVQAGKWKKASKRWRSLLDDPDPKVRGRARYNLALAQERAGHLDRALVLAQKAAVDLGNGKSRAYVAVLQERIANADRLERQMEGRQD
jgi:hypothetical protein